MMFLKEKKQQNSCLQSKSLRNKMLRKEIWRHRELYLFMLPGIVLVLIFSYAPMYGVLMAFQDVKIGDAFGQSDWVGLYHFKRFFNSHWLPIILKNTIIIALLTHVLAWPSAPILALLLHNSNKRKLSKVVQNCTYLPYLLSIVIVVSILNVFCGESGFVNIILKNLGRERINFFGDPNWVYPFHLILTFWMSTGYGAVVYLGALSSIDEEIIEASRIDGAGKLKCIWHIQIPSIMPTLITMLILNMGYVFTVGTDKALLLQTDLNLTNSEVVATYVYKAGVSQLQYGFSTAMGLFQNLINFVMLLTVNGISRKVSDTSVI
ncbi:MAG: sugar ABC transporter permease [Lachnospiraceae bacterium]|nr:sugar ABC transporter permease [Lachnospiraceae bacterium]